MRVKMARVASCFLIMFFAFCLNLFGLDTEIKQGEPLIKARVQINNGVLSVCLTAPQHLTICDGYRSFSREEGIGLESDFISMRMDSHNPKHIHFSVSAKPSNGGIDCIIDETQVFEEKGWFSDSLSKQESSYVIHIQNVSLNTAVAPDQSTAKIICKNSAVVHFGLSE